MKATVADIARSCGLSTATVDRVLNNRPGASAANRQRVMEAAKQLGYLPTLDQVVLPSKPAHLEFFLPIGSNAFMADLAHHIEDYAARLPLVASCRIHNLAGISPSALQSAVENLSLKANGVGVIAVDHPRTRNILRELVEAGIRLVTLVSDVPAAPRSAYVGIDNRVAGRTAALLMGRFLGGRTGHLAMMVGSRSYRGHEEREMGFRSVLSEEFPNLTVSSAVEINDERRRQLPRHHQGAARRTGSARHLLRRRRTLRRRQGVAGSQAAQEAGLHLPRPDQGDTALSRR